jgi:hypothetical protein
MNPAAITAGQYWHREPGSAQVETGPTKGVKNGLMYPWVFPTMISFYMGFARPVAASETILAKPWALLAGAVDRLKVDWKIGYEIIQCVKGVGIDDTQW